MAPQLWKGGKWDNEAKTWTQHSSGNWGSSNETRSATFFWEDALRDAMWLSFLLWTWGRLFALSGGQHSSDQNFCTKWTQWLITLKKEARLRAEVHSVLDAEQELLSEKTASGARRVVCCSAWTVSLHLLQKTSRLSGPGLTPTVTERPSCHWRPAASSWAASSTYFYSCF